MKKQLNAFYENKAINWNRKSCNTCMKGAVHHFGMDSYDCVSAKDCKDFDYWVSHKYSELKEVI